MQDTHSKITPKTERFILIILAATMFTIILDFMIVMPLGPQLMAVFKIGAPEFGHIVSSYTFSAGITGLLAAFFIDRFDRKKLLLGLYAGFTIGTFLCAIAPNHYFMVIARIVAGSFGGIMGAVTYAIIGDIIPYERRGAAMGVVMTAFSIASVAGVPFGLFLAASFDWHAPFYFLVGICILIFIALFYFLPNMASHIHESNKTNPIETIKNIFSVPNHLKAYSLTFILMLSGFSVIPFIATYMSLNVGVSDHELSFVYLFGGGATLLSSRFFGRLSDKYGKHKVFAINSMLTAIPILCITLWPKSSIWAILPISTLFFIVNNGRMVPAMAMITGSTTQKNRGSFMSFNSSIQQITNGFAALVAGWIIGTTATGALTNYWIVGIGSAVLSFAAIYFARKIRVLDVRPTKIDEKAAEVLYEM